MHTDLSEGITKVSRQKVELGNDDFSGEPLVKITDDDQVNAELNRVLDDERTRHDDERPIHIPIGAALIDGVTEEEVRRIRAKYPEEDPRSDGYKEMGMERQEPIYDATSGMSAGLANYDAQYAHRDSGALARAKLVARKAVVKTTRFLWGSFVFSLIVVVAATVGAGYWAWHSKTSTYYVDSRQCKLRLTDDLIITGTRQFGYTANELLGFRWVDTKTITEQTGVDIRGREMTIIGGLSPESVKKLELEQAGAVNKKPIQSWWSNYIGQGETGQEILKPADTYTFVLGKNVGMVDYKTFCR